MKITDENNKRVKKMRWPLIFASPGISLPTIDDLPKPLVSKIKIRAEEAKIYAVLRFDVPATEAVVRGYTRNLIQYVQDDGLTPSQASKDGDCIIGQYDALFSLNKRRNEVWVGLDAHPWETDT
jgi:hypothetical protein